MIGQTILHYRILDRLGEGGMGVVYKAEDERLGRLVALKFLPEDVVSLADRKRFENEARAISALNHPNIATLYDILETDGRLCLVLEYLSGASLRKKLEMEGSLPIGAAISITSQLSGALAHAHAKGILHRDVKPENILFNEEGRVKLADFGISKIQNRQGFTTVGGLTGTIAYMSPEQINGSEVDHRADIWALGVVLYEMLTGRQPFRADVQPASVFAILTKEPPEIEMLRGGSAGVLRDILTRLMAKDPRDRYQDCETVMRDLVQIPMSAARVVSESVKGGGTGGSLKSWLSQRRFRPEWSKLAIRLRKRAVAVILAAVAIAWGGATISGLLGPQAATRPSPAALSFAPLSNRIEILDANYDVLWSWPDNDAFPKSNDEFMRWFAFADLTGDGINEVVTTWSFPGDRSDKPAPLRVFVSGDSLLFQKPFARSRRYQSQDRGSVFHPSAVLVLSAIESHLSIFVLVNEIHSDSFIARLDSTGEEIGSFWHFGHPGWLSAIDSDADGREELWVTGVCDIYEETPQLGTFPFIAVLDPKKITGEGQSSVAGGFDMPYSDAEVYYVKLPKPPLLEDAMLVGCGSLKARQCPDGTVTVNIKYSDKRKIEGGFLAEFEYVLDSQMNVLQVKTGSNTIAAWQGFLERRIVDWPIDQELSRLRDAVVYWDGSQWTTGDPPPRVKQPEP